MKRLLTFLFALALVAAACGDSDDSGGSGADLGDGEQALADAVADQLSEDNDVLTADQAQCLAERAVDDIGLDRLAELGLTVEAVEDGADPGSVGMPTEDLDKILDAYLACADLASFFVEALTADGDISENSAECMAEGFDEDLIRNAARAGISGEEFDPTTQPGFISEMTQLMLDCLSDEEFQRITS